jgi:hypothetical protein
MAKCRTCGADIKWCKMATGTKMPLDAKPINVIQVKEDIGEVIPAYISHFATCGDADKWRKKNSKIR